MDEPTEKTTEELAAEAGPEADLLPAQSEGLDEMIEPYQDATEVEP
jgi:hypothetical protein